MDNDNEGGFARKLNFAGKIGNFLASSKRVLVIAKKPSKDEFMAMMKVTAIGVIIIGIIGVIVQLVFVLTGVGFAKPI
ncbi:MAG: protein translocase SEC61 complex subunit gamma [Candidatus ainarchaeum sp.]|nr:protein translocase SEC61 complex subunit gamma [Candidatus ainarchaeum sp.]